MPEKESDIVAAICDYLSLRNHMFWRQNTSPTVNKSNDGWSFRKMPRYARKGVPDIILIRPGGGFVGLEVKTRTGVQSAEQKEFEADCDRMGAEYFIVRSVDEVQDFGL